MYHFFGAITNKKGDALPGYCVRLTDSNGNSIALYSDGNGTPIVNVSGIADTAVVDVNGNASFWVNPGTYNFNIYAADASTLYQTIGSIPLGLDTITLAGGESVSSRSLMAPIAFPVSGQSATLTESGREGTFVFDSANHSAHVTADPNQGLYVAPSSDPTGASGAWVRKFSGAAESTWWGVSTAGTAAANTAAFNAALATLNALKVIGIGGGTFGSIGLHTPAGIYQFNGEITVEHALEITGDFCGGLAGGGTVGQWTSTTNHGFNFKGWDGVSNNAEGASIRGFYLKGPYSYTFAGVTRGPYHGINSQAMIRIENVTADGWPGNGFDVSGNISTNSGNASNSMFVNIASLFCDWTIRVFGPDVNTCNGYNVVGTSNRFGNINDQSGIGCNWFGGQCEGNGNDSNHPVRCHSGGHIYVVAYGEEAWCAANAPTGTTASNTGWLYLKEGSPDTTQPTWSAGQSWYFGAPCVQTNLCNSNFFGQYYEDYNPAVFAPFARVIPGGYDSSIVNFWVLGTNTKFPILIGDNTGGVRLKINGGGLVVGGDLEVQQVFNGNTTFSSVDSASDNTVILDNGNVYNSLNFRTNGVQQATLTIGSNTWFQRANTHYLQLNSGTIIGTWDSTGLNLGSGFALSYNGTAVISGGLLTAAASPAFTGDVAKSSGSLATTVNGAPTATTGILTTSTSGVGYRTGAGGTATQTTSRTTGVTINKPCGSITLVSAAGSATYSTFTVTNSTVAATDTVEVVQQSGSNLYNCIVTSVAAGSFKISVSAVSGTATESPVLNFTVTKGVSA